MNVYISYYIYKSSGELEITVDVGHDGEYDSSTINIMLKDLAEALKPYLKTTK